MWPVSIREPEEITDPPLPTLLHPCTLNDKLTLTRHIFKYAEIDQSVDACRLQMARIGTTENCKQKIQCERKTIVNNTFRNTCRLMSFAEWVNGGFNPYKRKHARNLGLGSIRCYLNSTLW